MAEVPLPIPTQAPVPSTDIRNAVFAGAKLDEEVTGTGEFYTDRLGVNRLTNTGRNNQFTAAQQDRANQFQQFLLSSGYVFLGDYEDGPFQFGARNQYIRYNNQYYRLNAATDVGFTTTGTTAATFANDVSHFVLMDGDTLRQNLASDDEGMGTSLIGTTYSGMNLGELIDSGAIYPVLWSIPHEKHQYLKDKNTALANAGDLVEYIESARDAAKSSGKTLFFPAGYYPVSRTVAHLPSTEWRGVALNSFLVATSDFDHATPLYQWAAATSQSRYICRGMAFDGNSAAGRFVGGVHINCGNATSDFSCNLITNCWHSGFRINPASGSRDVLNLNVSNIYIVNSGSASYYPGFSIEMSNSNFTDGQITGIDISGTAADPDSTRGPVAFSLIAAGKNIFNVLFERFFTSTRRNTHWYQSASNTFLLCNCSFRMFSGETHINTTGTLGNTVLVQMDLQNAGAWCSYDSLYANRSLNNGGLYIGNGYAPIFRNMNFLPAWDTSDDADDTLGQYLMGLQIASGCRKAAFENCAIENQYATTDAALWRYLWSRYMIDNGEGTRWESAFMTGNPVVQHSLDWYSINSTTVGRANNASYQGADITVSAGSVGQLTLAYPAVPSNASDQYIQYELLGSAQYAPGYYYLTAKVKFNSGIPGNHYLRLQMWGTNYTATLNTVGEEQWLCCRFAVVAGNTTVNKLILHVGNTSAAATGMSVTLSEVCLTTDRFAYPPNYRKTLQVL
ncbi:hypothetical protein [Klebsiella quasipneumoniae]|uniref:hypothetical protein n=1 Tax=Klebsiella quasipneumoniae TaxID=1463165 RepID=UPI0034D406F9